MEFQKDGPSTLISPLEWIPVDLFEVLKVCCVVFEGCSSSPRARLAAPTCPQPHTRRAYGACDHPWSVEQQQLDRLAQIF